MADFESKYTGEEAESLLDKMVGLTDEDGYVYSAGEKVDMRFTRSLLPVGTSIPANANLNTIEFLKIGKYYCSQNVDAKTVKNCPVNMAFSMEVFNPLSTNVDDETTADYTYRLRVLTPYNTGVQYIQCCRTSGTPGTWTYDSWYVTPRSKFALASSKNDGSAAIGASNKGVYIDSEGEIKAMSYTVAKSVPSNAVFTDTNTKVTAVENHYAPAEDESQQIDAPSGEVVTGIKRDAAGHVVGVVSTPQTGGGGGDSLWQEDTEGRAFCDRDIHVDGDISSSSTFIIGSLGVPLSEGYSTGDSGQILRANGDGSIGWDDLSIPTKVSQLENDNVYFTDFKVQDLELLVSGHLESLQIDGQGLMDAIYNGKTIFVPYGEAVIGGDAILLGEVVNTDIYFSVYTHQALVYYCEVIEVINDVIYGSGVIVGDLIAETVKQTQINNITHAAIANAMMTTGGYVFALPSDATGDEDDILLSRDSVKTINGQSIVRDEEGDDIHTTYPRVLATSASVALQPNVVTVWPSAITSQELTLSFSEAPQGFSSEFVVMFSVGADGVQLIVPDNVVWADGILPAMTNGKTYEISFVDNLATFLEF